MSARIQPVHTRSIVPCLVLFFAALVPSGPSAAQQPDPYAKAQQLFATRQYREAAALFAEAATLPGNPHPEALLQQAKSLARLDNSLDAAAADPILRRYLVSNPRSAPALYLLGYVLQRENKPRESLAIFTQAAAIAPPLAEDLRLVAMDYVLLNDYPDAIHWLDRALAADPNNAEAWYALGRSHMEQGDFVAAERDLRRTLALTPANPKALNNLGLSLEAQNRPDEALTAYTAAIAAQSKPDAHPTEQPLLNLGTLLNTRTRSAEAIKPLQAAIALTPGCARCHEELARALQATHQDAPALHEMEQAVSLDPQNPRLHYQLGQIYRRLGLSAKADVELKESAAQYGSHSTPEKR